MLNLKKSISGRDRQPGKDREEEEEEEEVVEKKEKDKEDGLHSQLPGLAQSSTSHFSHLSHKLVDRIPLLLSLSVGHSLPPAFQRKMKKKYIHQSPLRKVNKINN